jgi:DNA modification methylase
VNSSLPITIVDPRKLIPHERNWAIHTERQKSAVRASLEEFGWVSPVVVSQRSGKIIDGHERVEEAVSLEYEGVPVHYVDVDAETELRMLAALNRTASLREENPEALASLLAELAETERGIEALPGWDAEDLEQRLKALAYEAEGSPDLLNPPEEDEEELERILEKAPARAAPGDLWALGPHRLLCGSATRAEDVLRVMQGYEADLIFTDPPYGVQANGGRSTTVKSKGIQAIENDDLEGDRLIGLWRSAFELAPLKEDGSFYVCYDEKRQFETMVVLQQVGWRQRATIVWQKENFGLSGFKGYRPKFELIAFGHSGADYTWYGDLAQGNIWEESRDRERPGNHPTPKPVPLVKRALLNSSAVGQRVFDMFAGVGSTLIACEETGRVCHAIELVPEYADVILERWARLTGKEPEKL